MELLISKAYKFIHKWTGKLHSWSWAKLYGKRKK